MCDVSHQRDLVQVCTACPVYRQLKFRVLSCARCRRGLVLLVADQAGIDTAEIANSAVPELTQACACAQAWVHFASGFAEEEEGFYKFLPANTADRLCQLWQSCSNHHEI